MIVSSASGRLLVMCQEEIIIIQIKARRDSILFRVLMGLQQESSLVCFINMRGGARGAHTPTRHHVKTLAATSSQHNLETLAICEVLAHPHVMFHPCTCGLCGGVTAVPAALIGYNDVDLV
jgi:hypothetical protein